MTQFLPPNLLVLFAPREPIPWLPPVDKLPHEKKKGGYTGVSDYLHFFEDPKETPPPTRVETREERRERKRRERAELVAYKLEQEIALWNPINNSSATSDPFKTLFVARINYDTSESKLRREFEVYGPIKKIIMCHNTINGKPRGYAFIEYEHERDMHSAYKHADGKKIDGRRVLVDVERARTVKGWLPRRLGGGLGGTRRGGPDVNIKHSGREDNERERERYRQETERDALRGRGGSFGAGGARGGGGGLDRGSRDRERDRDRRERSRSRDRERKRRSRSRSRDRKRRHGGERFKDPDIEEVERIERNRSDRKRNRRSRSRDREKERRRRERRERREREEKERGGGKDRDDADAEAGVRIKEEPMDDYPDYNDEYSTPMTAAVKYEADDDEEEMLKKHENGDQILINKYGGHHHDDDRDDY